MPQTEQTPRPETKQYIGTPLALALTGALHAEHSPEVAAMRMNKKDVGLLTLRYLDHMSSEDIARRTGIPYDRVVHCLTEFKDEISAHIKEHDTRPLTLDVLNEEEEHVVVRTDGPARIEMNRYSGGLVLFGYEGRDDDPDQQPDIAYTS